MDEIQAAMDALAPVITGAIAIGIAVFTWTLGRAIVEKVAGGDEFYYEGQEEKYSDEPEWVAKSEMQDDVLDALIAEEITQDEASELWSRHDY